MQGVVQRVLYPYFFRAKSTKACSPRFLFHYSLLQCDGLLNDSLFNFWLENYGTSIWQWGLYLPDRTLFDEWDWYLLNGTSIWQTDLYLSDGTLFCQMGPVFAKWHQCLKPSSWPKQSSWPQTKPHISNWAMGPETRLYTPNRCPICTQTKLPSVLLSMYYLIYSCVHMKPHSSHFLV